MNIFNSSIILFLFIPFSLTFLSGNYNKKDVALAPIPIQIGTSTVQKIEPPKRNCNLFRAGILEEKVTAKKSEDVCWWLDSGGEFIVDGTIGRTIFGSLSDESIWKIEYNKTNPVDTNNGSRPQNIFRLINTSRWKNVSVSILFRILLYDLSNSPNRNSSNGVLLMSHYVNSDNLYYAGLRVDGTAIIKKKSNGIYTTLAMTPFNTDSTYDHHSNPILLPLNTWIGQKFVTVNNKDGSVNLKLYINLGKTDEWRLILEVNDSFEKSGSPPILNTGNIGIRTDFMDVEFSNFSAKSP